MPPTNGIAEGSFEPPADIASFQHKEVIDALSAHSSCEGLYARVLRKQAAGSMKCVTSNVYFQSF
jgi:hypothetical protein